MNRINELTPIINFKRKRRAYLMPILKLIRRFLNVLKRYYKCAKRNQLKTIIRITSDCPFVDPKMIDDFVLVFDLSDLKHFPRYS